MIVLQKLVFSELKVVVHLGPRSSSASRVVRHERNERCRSYLSDSVRVAARSVPLVGRDFRDLKILRRGVDESGKQFCVTGKLPVNFNGSYHVGFDAAHDVAFHPVLLHFGGTIFDVKPTSKPRGCKTGRIDREISLDGLQRQTAFCNQFVQERSQRRILKVIGDAVKVRDFGDMPTSVCFSEVAYETALRDSGIDLEHDAEYRVRQGERWASILGRSNGKARTQISEQRLESVLLVSLGVIVSSPILRIGSPLLRFSDGHSFGDCRASVRVLLAFHNEGRGEDMLAFDPACFMVGTSARRCFGRKVDFILVLAELRRDKPNAFFPNDDSRCRQFHSTLFSQVHDALASLENILLARYIVVKSYFEIFSLDSISLSGILPAWDWSRSNKWGTNAVGASTSGCLDTVPRANRGFAPNANRLIGINLEKTNEKIHKSSLKKFGGGCEVRTRKCSHTAVLQTAPLPVRGTPPLNGRGGRIQTGVSQFRAGHPRSLDDATIYGASGEGASKTSTPRLHSKESGRTSPNSFRNNQYGCLLSFQGEVMPSIIPSKKGLSGFKEGKCFALG